MPANLPAMPARLETPRLEAPRLETPRLEAPRADVLDRRRLLPQLRTALVYKPGQKKHTVPGATIAKVKGKDGSMAVLCAQALLKCRNAKTTIIVQGGNTDNQGGRLNAFDVVRPYMSLTPPQWRALLIDLKEKKYRKEEITAAEDFILRHSTDMAGLREDMRDRETAEQMVVMLDQDNRDLVFPWDFANLDQADCFRINVTTGNKQQASLVKVMSLCMATHTVVVAGDSRLGKTVLARALAKACAP